MKLSINLEIDNSDLVVKEKESKDDLSSVESSPCLPKPFALRN